MSSKVTMKMIAEAVGTSVGTVDRALNNRGRINADMKAQILLVAEEMGYRPNLFAQQLRKAATVKLLIVVRKSPHYIYHALQLGIDDALNEYVEFGIESEFIYTDTMSREDTLNLLNHIDISTFSALLIDAYYTELSCFAQRFKLCGKPVVTVHMDLPQDTRDIFVGPDIVQGGKLTADYIGVLLRNQGSVFILDAEMADPQWLIHLTNSLTHHYPHIIIKKILWPDICLPQNSDVLLVCGPVDFEKRLLLSKVRCTVVCNQINEHIREMLAANQISAVIYDNPYLQGYQSVRSTVGGLIRNTNEPEGSVLVSPQLILRASLQALPLPAPARKV